MFFKTFPYLIKINVLDCFGIVSILDCESEREALYTCTSRDPVHSFYSVAKTPWEAVFSVGSATG